MRNKDLLKNNFFLDIEKPESHLDAYDTVIEMLEMSISNEVVLDARAFKQYVKDEWDWANSFANTTVKYAAVGNARK
jgi:hypothetical protein